MRVAVDSNTLLSGLFFRGNERRLLLESLAGRVTLVFAEDVVDEVYEVIEKTFSRSPSVPEALALLEAILREGEPVERERYEARLPTWEAQIRDPSDAPILACAEAVATDAIVTGDRDLLESPATEPMGIVRTRDVLARLPPQRGL